MRIQPVTIPYWIKHHLVGPQVRMTRRPATSAAVLIGVVVAAAGTGCAPAAGAACRHGPRHRARDTDGPGHVSTDGHGQALRCDGGPTGRAGTPAGGLPPTSTLTSADSDVVAAARLTGYYRADTALDFGPAGIHRRALPWTTGQLAAGIRGDRPVAEPGAAWTALAAHHGYTTVTVARAYNDGAPADTVSTAFRQFVVTVPSHGRAHWTGPPVTHTDFLVLRRTTGGWRIADLADNS